MKKFQFVFVLALAFLRVNLALGNEAESNIAQGWPNDAIEWSKKLGQVPRNFRSSEAVTAWAAAHSVRYKYLYYKDAPEFETVQLPSRHFASGRMAISVQLRRDPRGKILSGPLVIFLPGLFGDRDSPSAYRAAYHFGTRGYHFVALSNPWSVPYIKNRPCTDLCGERIPGTQAADIAEPGNLEEEALVVLEAIAEVKRRYFSDPSKPTTIHLVGESYGALLSMVTGALDSRLGQLLNGQVTLYGPPLDIQAGLKSLDIGYQASSEVYQDTCKRQETFLLFRLIAADPEKDWGDTLRGCTVPMIYQNFQHQLLTTAQIFKENKHLNLDIPKDLKFMDFVEKFTPGNFSEIQLGKKTNLWAWAQKFAFDRLKALRIMTAQDDFLNQDALLPMIDGQPLSWQRVEGAFQGAQGIHLIVLPWGGHVGFVGLDQFQSLPDQEGLW